MRIKQGHGIYPIIHIIITTLFSSMAWHMLMPFMAIILSRLHNFSPVIIGTIAGIGPLIQSIFGLVSGLLIDKVGHRYSLTVSLLLSSMLIFSIYASSWISIYILLYALLGMSYSFFNIGSKVAISFLTSEVNRLTGFNFQYISFNIGAIMGPLVGGFFLEISPATIFLIAAASFAIASAILAVGMMLNDKEIGINQTKNGSLRKNLSLLKDRSLILILAGNFIVWFCFSQVWTTLPQYLNKIGLVGIYSHLLIMNAVLVIICQGFLSAIIKIIGRKIVVFCGIGCLFLAYFSIATLENESVFYVSIAFLTFSEMILFSINNIIIDGKASTDSKGFLFGMFQLTMIGIPIGSIVGSFVLEVGSPKMLFQIVAICSLGLFVIYQKYFKANRRVQ